LVYLCFDPSVEIFIVEFHFLSLLFSKVGKVHGTIDDVEGALFVGAASVLRDYPACLDCPRLARKSIIQLL